LAATLPLNDPNLLADTAILLPSSSSVLEIQKLSCCPTCSR
jgi:hypothetical protein